MCQISNKSMSVPEAIWNVKSVKRMLVRLGCFLEISVLIRVLNTYSMRKSLCFNFIHNVGLTFCYEISLHYSLFQGKFGSSIEIRCSEYITLTSCCQHWFPFLPEIWCRNPLQADKYLYTWLPDLIAFCKGGCIGVTLNACHSTLYSSSVMPYDAPRRALI